MDINKASQLWDDAHEIRIERDDSDNSAERVGKLLEGMIEYDMEEADVISTLEGEALSLQRTTEELRRAIQEGGGGGNGNIGEQKNYFINVPHNTVPATPIDTDYDSTSNCFIHGSQVWTQQNNNTVGTEDTWQLSAWFYAGEPQAGTISITRILDGSIKNSSNGEDREEIEFIYLRTKFKADQSTINTWGTILGNAKVGGSTQLSPECGKTSYSEEDAVPVGWVDTAQGINDVYKYEYRSERKSSLDLNGNRIWGVTGFSSPILISAYGDRGLDGDGVEYIFYANNTGTLPATTINMPQLWKDADPQLDGVDGKTYQDNEYIPDGSLWQDEPIDLETSGLGQGAVEWVSIRKKITVTKIEQEDEVDHEVKVSEWQSYSSPKVWSRLSKDGIVNGYTVDFNNENMPVVVNGEGSVSSYRNSGRVQVFHNGEGLRYKETLSSGDTDYFTYTIDSITYSDERSNSSNPITAIKNSNDGAEVLVSLSGTLLNFYGVNAYIDMTVTLPNSTTSKLRCTLYGIHIEGAESVDLFYSAAAVRVDSVGQNPTPPTLDMGVKIGRGVGVLTTYLSGDNNSTNGSAEDQGFIFGWGFDGDSPTYHPSTPTGPIQLSAETDVHTLVTVEMRYGNTWDTAIFIDSEDIPYIKDGSSGGRGVRSTTSYYKATNIAPNNDGSNYPNPSIYNPLTSSGVNGLYNAGWRLDAMSTGWGTSNKYLYKNDFTEYTDGTYGWGNTQYDRVWIDPPEGENESGYTVVVTPPYAIFEEPLIREELNGTVQYSVGAITPLKFNISVKILKGTEAQPIWYTNRTTTSCKGTVSIRGNMGNNQNYNNDELIVEIENTDISDGAINGSVSFILTLKQEGSSSFEPFTTVNVPFYVNRLGSRTQNIFGDVETTILDKTSYIYDNAGHTLTLRNLGEYLRSSTSNLANLSTTVGGIQTNLSTIEQTSDAINFSVNNGWDNYIANPFATDGEVTNHIDTNGSKIVEDNFFGKVREIKYSVGSNYQLKHSFVNYYSELTNQQVTWFCIVKNISKGSNDVLKFGNVDGGELIISPIGGSQQLNVTGRTGVTPSIKGLKGYWYLAYVTRTLNGAITSSINDPVGFNQIKGTWQIYYCGVLKGKGVPTLEMIMSGAGLHKAGINISNGTITSKGENFKWENDNGQQILGLNADGDAEFTGIIRAKTFYHDVCIVGYNMWRKYEKEAYFQVLPTVDLQGNPTGQTSLIISENDSTEYIEIPCNTENEAIAKRVEAEEFYSKLIIGNYYDYETLNSDYFAPELFSAECTGNCDVIIVPYDDQGSTVRLPKPEDFEGKIIEIYDYTYSQPGDNPPDYQVITLDNSEFAHEIYLSSSPTRPVKDPGSITSVTVGGGTTSKFYSIKLSNVYYWLRIQ